MIMDIASAEDVNALRFGLFVAVLLAMAVAEAVLPRRERSHPRLRRWPTNLGMALIDSLVVRFLFPVVAVGTAAFADARSWGLLGAVALPLWLEVLIAVVVLDLAIYAQHVAMHKVPVLWRLHRVHHADPDLDVTTGIRFHPIEIALSMLYKMALVLILGPTAFAVFLFEAVLNAMSLATHANLRLPLGLDRALRLVFVTPDMHRVHHSVERIETDSNYGFNLSVWDRLFRTYRPQPRAGHRGMTIGLPEYRTDAPTRLGWSLMLPFGSTSRVSTGSSGNSGATAPHSRHSPS